MSDMQQSGGYDYAALDTAKATLAQQAARETITRHKDPQPEQLPAAPDDDELGRLLDELAAALMIS
jgi:hypothetical protein